MTVEEMKKKKTELGFELRTDIRSFRCTIGNGTEEYSAE